VTERRDDGHALDPVWPPRRGGRRVGARTRTRCRPGDRFADVHGLRVEYSATSAEGKFVGYAVGRSGDAALWNADVRPEALSPSCYPSGCLVLPGGSIALVASGGDSVRGSFTGDSITLIRQDSGCAKQIFHVVGEVETSFGDGTATFDVALTHYRKSIFGVCVTYGASIGPDTTELSLSPTDFSSDSTLAHSRGRGRNPLIRGSYLGWCRRRGGTGGPSRLRCLWR
jgi:hypothetical protein